MTTRITLVGLTDPAYDMIYELLEAESTNTDAEQGDRDFCRKLMGELLVAHGHAAAERAERDERDVAREAAGPAPASKAEQVADKMAKAALKAADPQRAAAQDDPRGEADR